jgi:alkylated DNA repair protein alkB homolog 6
MSNTIQTLPPACQYFPDFISPDEEARVSDEIKRLPAARWTTLSRRRLLSLPSTLTGPGKDTMIDASLPKFLDNAIIERFTKFGIFKDSPHNRPNHVLANEYQPGQGIMPHTDGPAYYPVTATVSLGGHTVLEIYMKNAVGEREPDPAWRILQEPRSLLVTSGEMYSETLHGISEAVFDEDLSPETVANWDMLGDPAPFESGRAERSTRISLTYRDVLRVAKLGGALKFMNKR